MPPCIVHDGFTATYERLTVDHIDLDAIHIFSSSGSECRAHLPVWDEVKAKRSSGCVEVIEQRNRDMTVRTDAGDRSIILSDEAALATLFSHSAKAYIDISGLSHNVWGPMVRAALLSVNELLIVYVEPGKYKPHASPASQTLFDLSDGFRGLEPLPTFANLTGPTSETNSLFIPFLGFEGTRARYLAMTLDPLPKVIPIVGVPGFRAEYSHVTIASNQEFLAECDAYSEVRFARASCPFEAYSALVDIRTDHPNHYMYLAPIGTKPHALGAIWYAIDNPQNTELMYDHPLRKPGRTEGIRRTHIYRLKPRDADL